MSSVGLGDLYAGILSPSVCHSAQLGIREEDPEPAAESSKDLVEWASDGSCSLFMLEKSLS